MAQVTKDDVLKLAKLARLSISEAEAESFQGELSAILGYIEQLADVDTTGLAPTSQVTGLTNVVRPDEVVDYGYNPLSLLDNVPNVQDNQVKVRRMIG